MSKELADQLAELQSQFVFQEDSIQKLSEALYSQQVRIDEMERKIEHLKNELEKAQSSPSNTYTEAEVPPHY